MSCRLGLAVLFAVQLLLVAQLTKGRALPELEKYAQQLAQQRLFAGMLHVDQGGSTVFSKGFGLSSYELDAPMRNDHRYPIGSNTKLFTAVALWQLHRAGKLSVYDPAAKYINATELGLDGPWCPRVYGAPKTGPCQQPQIQHLLRMSGGVLGFDNCEYKDGAWQQQYCMVGAKSPSNFSFTNYQNMQFGAASIADYLRLTGALRMPLEFQPGSQYHYSNLGYSLAGYIVEKVSGLPIADYFRINIFDKYGLSSTVYDPSNGVTGIHKRQLPYPAYITYLQPGGYDAIADTSGATLQQLVASTGSSLYWGGDVNASTAATASAKQLASSSVSVGMTAKYPGPSGFDWTVANAAGAIVSTPQDMAKWFRALLVGPDHLGLGKQLLREFLSLSTDIPGMPGLNVSSNSRVTNATLVYAQGLLVVKNPQHSRGLGVSNVYYLGSLGAFQAVAYMWLHPSDPSKDVFINAVAATVLPDRKEWPAAAQDLTGARCLEHQVSVGNGNATGSSLAAAGGRPTAGRRLLATAAASITGAGAGAGVLRVLCELSNMVPSVIKTLPDVLARKAFVGVTGHEWFGLIQ